MKFEDYKIQEKARLEIRRHEKAIELMNKACRICSERYRNGMDERLIDYSHVCKLLRRGFSEVDIMSMTTEEVKGNVSLEARLLNEIEKIIDCSGEIITSDCLIRNYFNFSTDMETKDLGGGRFAIRKKGSNSRILTRDFFCEDCLNILKSKRNNIFYNEKRELVDDHYCRRCETRHKRCHEVYIEE